MDNLLKQLRVKFSGIGQEDQDDSYNTAEGRTRPRKTVSFKGEKKKKKNWFERQFSDNTSDIDDSIDGEFATAVAAAALAITLLEGDGTLDQKKSDEELRRILTKTKSKMEGSIEKPNNQSKLFRWLSGKEEKDGGKISDETSMRKSATQVQRSQEDSDTEQRVSVKTMGTTSSVKKTQTFSDKRPNDMGSKKIEQNQPPKTGQNVIFPKPRVSSSGSKQGDGNVINSSEVETEVDVWKKAKLAKIKRRHEKLMSTIMEWENEKKTKAKRRMERREKEIEERRARVLQEYRNDISRIDKVAGGARAVADERKRNDEAKIIEKANASSASGKLPTECSCF